MIPAVIFCSVLIGILALYFLATALWDSPGSALKRRLQRLENDGQPEAFSADAPGRLLREEHPFHQVVFRFPLLKRLEKLVAHSGTSLSPLLFVVSVTMTSVSVFFSAFLWFGNTLVAMAAMSVVGSLPVVYLLHRRKRRQIKFEEQLPDALTMIARSLRAGHSLAAAVELIGNELPQPTGGLFRSAYEQQQLGMRITDALSAMTGKIVSLDLHFFVTIVRVNSESGGSLAEVLEKLAETVRSRLQVRRQVRTYTAEGRMSGYVLLALPVVVFAVFNLKNPKYMEVFFTVPACRLSLFAAAVAQAVGFLVIRKIVNIRI